MHEWAFTITWLCDKNGKPRITLEHNESSTTSTQTEYKWQDISGEKFVKWTHRVATTDSVGMDEKEKAGEKGIGEGKVHVCKPSTLTIDYLIKTSCAPSLISTVAATGEDTVSPSNWIGHRRDGSR